MDELYNVPLITKEPMPEHGFFSIGGDEIT
jgi:hypothetical protein